MEQHVASLFAERYAVEREIGRGGMAVVYLAWDRRQMRRVALKVLRPEVASVVSTERFLREIRLTGSFQHPHILPLHDSGTDGDQPFYVMPYVDGESLRDRIARDKQLAVADALSIAQQVADALAHAHARGIVHRDVSPGNVLLATGSGEPSVFVTDFGIARAVGESDGDRLTSTGIIVGTADHMSPEQAAGDRHLDARTDIYSLGSVLYEMLAGVPPFTGPTAQAILGRKITARAPSVRELRPSLPRHVERAIARALETAPADRFASVEEFAAALRGTGEDDDGGAASDPRIVSTASNPILRRRRARRRRRTAVAAMAALLIAAGGVGAVLSWNSPGRVLARAEVALGDGDLTVAASDFSSAANRLDGVARARASLGYAEALFLNGADSTAEWRVAVAAASDSSLSPVDASMAHAFAAVAAKNYPDACSRFRNLSSQSVIAGLALMRCIHADRTIVPDPASPSGWRFRTSYDEAVRVAHAVLPRISVGSPLRAIAYRLAIACLYPENRKARWGRDEAGREFMALGELRHDPSAGDTAAYVPYPAASYMTGRGPSNAAANEQALERDRSLLRDFASAWARERPNDADGHRELAHVLELTGELASSRGGAPAALDEVRAARRLSRGSAERLLLARDEVRLFVKLGDFERARTIVDSLMALPDALLDSASVAMAALAGLTGRASMTMRLLQAQADTSNFFLPSGRVFRPRPELAHATWALMAYAAVGSPVDSLRAAKAAFEDRLNEFVSAASRDSVRAALLEYPLVFAVPVLGPAAVADLPGATYPVVKLEQAMGRGDFALVRTALDSVQRVRATRLASSTSLDQTYIEAWLRVAVADTVGAIRQLDGTLNALSALTSTALNDVIPTASLPRAMRLRAVLASRAGDRATAARWTSALSALWKHADVAVDGTP